MIFFRIPEKRYTIVEKIYAHVYFEERMKYNFGKPKVNYLRSNRILLGGASVH